MFISKKHKNEDFICKSPFSSWPLCVRYCFLNTHARARASASAQACARARLLHGFARALATWACYMLHTLAATWLTRSLVFQILAFLLLVGSGSESQPDARLAPGFALARDSWLGILAWCASGSWLCSSNPGLIRVWLQVFFFFSSRFARKFNFKFCSRYSNKIFLRASRES